MNVMGGGTRMKEGVGFLLRVNPYFTQPVI